MDKNLDLFQSKIFADDRLYVAPVMDIVLKTLVIQNKKMAVTSIFSFSQIILQKPPSSS